ncbi:MAG: hypothetical protein OEO82_04915 [Gammaproteobacteria bacterium]|nr:hypothetical protein [Gammaproteobacteria bacterium]
MFNASKLALFTVGLLLSIAGVADDAPQRTTHTEQESAATPRLHNLLAESEYESRSQLLTPIDRAYVRPGARRPAAEFHFHDTSVVSRAGKLRSLSLLTLVETERTRLFLGINSDGLAGLHLYAINPNRDEFHLDLARAPYLPSKGAHQR